MDVKQTFLLELFQDTETRLTVPAYQRIYSWGHLQCTELWLDIARAARDDRPHFTGIMLFSHDVQDAESEIESLSIIDGQQRLTTLTILFLALARYLESREQKPASRVPDAKTIREKVLCLGRSNPPARRLTLSREDDVVLNALIKGEQEISSRSSNLQDNLAFFSEKMQEPDFDAELLWEGLSKLLVISVLTDEPESAQEIFESTNSKGLPLSLADMVRNYLLLEEESDEQTRLYNEYWAEAESLFEPDPGSLRINSAIKAWMSIRFRKARMSSPEHIYSSFKQYVEDEFSGTGESVLLELRSFCLMWREQYRYHAVRKYLSRDWAVNGAQTRTSTYARKSADNEEYATRLQKKLESIDDRW